MGEEQQARRRDGLRAQGEQDPLPELALEKKLKMRRPQEALLRSQAVPVSCGRGPSEAMAGRPREALVKSRRTHVQRAYVCERGPRTPAHAQGVPAAGSGAANGSLFRVWLLGLLSFGSTSR